MSTQPSAFPPVPFSISTPQQHFRLLELPPELLELLTSKDRPATLDLKSAAPTTDKPGTKTSPGYLHLCTNTTSWAVRQVSTSNSVWITKPSSNSSTFSPGIIAVSKPTSHLELIPAKPSTAEIKSAIQALLPVQGSPDANIEAAVPPSLIHESLLASIPYPRDLITQTLRSVFAFSASSNGHLYIPSPTLLLHSWTLFTQHAALLNVHLDDPNRQSFGDVAETVLTDEGSSGAGQVYCAVIQAIYNEFADTSMSDSGDPNGTRQPLSEHERKNSSTRGPFKSKEVTSFVGQILVRCSGAKGIGKHELLSKWSELIPLSWEKYRDLASLGGEYRVANEIDSGSSEIVWYDGSASVSAGTTSNTGPAAVTGKRKWHEKFAAQRNQK